MAELALRSRGSFQNAARIELAQLTLLRDNFAFANAPITT
jgi:hypothetical protein